MTAMQPDYLPAVIEFVKCRMESINFHSPDGTTTDARLEELGMILSLCHGLQRQGEMISATTKPNAA